MNSKPKSRVSIRNLFRIETGKKIILGLLVCAVVFGAYVGVPHVFVFGLFPVRWVGIVSERTVKTGLHADAVGGICHVVVGNSDRSAPKTAALEENVAVFADRLGIVYLVKRFPRGFGRKTVVCIVARV